MCSELCLYKQITDVTGGKSTRRLECRVYRDKESVMTGV